MPKHNKTSTEIKADEIQRKLDRYERFKKTKPIRSNKCREWFREQTCCISGEDREQMVTGHHRSLNGGVMGSKCCDTEQIPLRMDLHMEIHRGEKAFCEKYNINIVELVNFYKDKVRGELGILL